MGALRVALLGPPYIEVDGEPLSVDTRKAVAVLATVAVSGAQSRLHLAAVLWPDSDQTRARSALRRTLSVLNKGLGGRWLLLEDQSVGLESEGRWIDVEAFDHLRAPPPAHDHAPTEPCATCLERYEEAAALHRGELLEGFALRGAPRFEEWQFSEAERLRRELAQLLDRLVNAHARARAYDRAVDHARRRLGLDPLHEPTHRRLMLLHAWSGHRADAIRQYRECVAELQRQLGVTPLEQTTALYESILSGHHPPAPPADGVVPAGPVPTSRTPPRPGRTPTARPFVGRGHELDALLRAHDAAGDGHLAVVEGELGIGKTRLVAQLADRVRRAAGATLTVRCHAGETELAFTAVADLLRQVLTHQPEAPGLLSPAWRREIAPLVPDLVGSGSSDPDSRLDTAEARRRLLEAIRQTVLLVAQDTPPALVTIDDAQWVDEASLGALSYLSNRLEGARLLLVLVWRSENVGADHRLRRIVASLRGRGMVTHLELERLGRGAVGDLVDASGLDLDAARIERLHAETEGLPLFLVEYLRALEDGLEEDDWPVPTGVRDLVLTQLAPLSGIARQLVTAAAAIGRSFDLETVRQVSGRGDEELVAALEELVDAGLIAEVGEGQRPVFDFRHDKLRTTAYEETSLARRRLLHGRIADAYDRPAPHPEPVPDATVAQHLRLAGRDRESGARFVAAAQAARALAAHAEAISHYRAALALDHDEPPVLHEAIGDLLTLQGDYGSAIRAYEAAAALTDAPDELARLEYSLAAVHTRRGGWDAAETHIEIALGLLSGDAPDVLRARLLAERAMIAHRLDRGEAVERAEQALASAELTADPETLAQAQNIRGMVFRATGDTESATETLERSLRLAEQHGSRSGQLAALNNLSLVAADRGEYPRALELAKSALAICRSLGDRHREAALLNNLADLLHAAGQEDEAMRHLKQSVALFSEVGEPETLEPEIWKLVDW